MINNINFQYFPEIFGDVVTKANAAIQANANLTKLQGLNLQYEYGTLFELTKAIDIKNAIDAAKYPLVWLVWERPENMKQFKGAYSNKSYNVSPLVYIAHYTDPNYSSRERYTEVFQPVLHPIYNELIHQLTSTGTSQESGQLNIISSNIFSGGCKPTAEKSLTFYQTILIQLN